MQNQKKKKKKVNTCFSAIHLLNDPQGKNMAILVSISSVRECYF